jgi:hypothetical protein
LSGGGGHHEWNSDYLSTASGDKGNQ